MIAQAISATVALLALAGGCGGPASKHDPADNGRYQFHTYGRFQFGKTLTAKDAPAHGAACRWRIETEPKAGLKPGQSPRVVGHGTWSNHKIKVAKPDTVDVYLVTNSACGRWS